MAAAGETRLTEGSTRIATRPVSCRAHLIGMTTAYSTRTAIGIDLSRVTLSQHFLAQAVAKGITAAQIRDALTKPYQVTDVLRYPGQKRYCGRGVHGTPGVAVVVDVEDMRAITLYLDGVVTEMRTDQRGDLAAQNSRRLASIR